MKEDTVRLPPNTLMNGFSWRGGTRPRHSDETDSREQSEEPPAEYWEEKYSKHREQNNEEDSKERQEEA